MTGQMILMALVLLAHSPTSISSKDNNLVISGQLVCLDADLRETSCEGIATRFALKAAAGPVYPFASGQAANTLFQEKRLKTREFRLTMRSLNGGKTFQIVKTQLIRSGKVYNFHYFCEICNITTYAPGPCMCCRTPTEYREASVTP